MCLCSRFIMPMIFLPVTLALTTLALTEGRAQSNMQSQPGKPIEYRHGYAFVFPLKYPEHFEHFDYVNPDAPTGGQLRVSASGSYNSFNHWAGRGRPADGLAGSESLLYDQLLIQSADEPAGFYGLVAEGVAVSPNYDWVAFRLREEPRFHDGEPITLQDVVFTLEVLKEHGAPGLRTILRDVHSHEVLGEREIRFDLNPDGLNNRNLIEVLGTMTVLPKHYWVQRDSSRTTRDPPLGSGPYRVSDFRMGRYLVYERVQDYWARDLPVMQGRFNFDEIKFDYFLDEQLRRQALRSGVFDLLIELVSKSWTIEYDIPAYEAGHLKRLHLNLLDPSGMFWPLTWNLRRERFDDIRVREALWLLFDFRYTNRVQRFDYYQESVSLFQGSSLAHSGLPSEAELKLLEPLRDHIPERVFTEPYQPPPGTGYGYNRQNKIRALELFEQAGWVLRDLKLVHHETGEQFQIDFVSLSPALNRAILPYQQTLERLGIRMRVRAVEQANYLNRMQNRQFDATRQSWTPEALPGPRLRHQFSSEASDQRGSLNWAGIRHPAVDALIDIIIHAEDEETLLAASRAFDRVMLWSFYFVPMGTDSGVRYVYWDRFGRPESDDLHRPTHLDTWWYDTDASAQIDAWLH